jgi:hypothetical protein
VISLRPTPALLKAMAAAVVCLWLSFAVVAGAIRTSPRAPAARAATPARESGPIGLALRPAPALQVRRALFATSVYRARPRPASHRQRRRVAAAALPAQAAPAPAMSAPVATPAPTVAVQAPPADAPKTRPAPKPRPVLTAEPKHPSAPDFDESAPVGFDNAG